MNPRRSFTRKIGYLVVIALLLIPLFWLSHPATPASKEGQGGPGGQLAQLRQEGGLNQTHLGQIDATSETIKLATVGMRGVATVFLWEKANDYKKRKDWTNLSATLTQLTKLEPHFTSVWRHQAWNLAYNVSAEFDGYQDRYRWVIRGIEFLQSGIPFNRTDPRLTYDVGRLISWKLGRADEHKQFRRLFKEDDDFNGPLPKSERDNWLVGKDWHRRAERLVAEGAALKTINPVVFYSEGPMCQMNYAEALEGDGIFQEKAQLAWRQASKEWQEFGASDLTLADIKEPVRLGELEVVSAELSEVALELESLSPDLRKSLVEKKRKLLSPKEREILVTPANELTEEQMALAEEVGWKLIVPNTEFARNLPVSKQKAGLALAARLDELNKKERILKGACETANYLYWKQRALYEQEPETLAAREQIYNGDQAFKAADLLTAKEAYNRGWAEWRKLFDNPQFPKLLEDSQLCEGILAMFDRYTKILEKCDEPFPRTFILADVINPYMKKRAEAANEEYHEALQSQKN